MSAGRPGNRLCALLGIDVPIVLAPFGGLSSVELTASVSDAGGLGSYGLYGYAPQRIAETVHALRRATDRPFAVNLWLPDPAPRDPDEEEFGAAVDAVMDFFDELGLPRPERPREFLPPFEEQIDEVLELAPSAVSFVYGVPPAHVVVRARDRGITVVGTATTVAEAVALEAGGVDAIVATGAEAAGHRVSFLDPAEESLVGALALVPQVVDAVTVPVIAAGGIADRRGVAAAFALGAEAVQVGTAFLRTRQSAANQAHRQAIVDAADHSTVLTRAMSGRLARGVPNRATRTIEASGAATSFPAQNWITGRFRAEAGRREVGELQSLWMGQSAALARHDDAGAVMAELAAGLPRDDRAETDAP